MGASEGLRVTTDTDVPELPVNHDHMFLTVPGRCYFCGITTEELRRQAEHKMLVDAYNRLADVLEKLEAKL